MTGPGVRRLSLPASLSSLQAFLEFGHAGANAAGLTAADRDQLDLVLEELLVNIARYAYQPGTGDVEVAYTVESDGKLLVQIADKGRIFNPLEKEEPDLSSPLEDRPVGGLGIFLVRELVDSLSYRREQGRNTVSFRFPGPKQPVT
ncbi:MAG TPA: ATP-binding protein [Bryobacteraceae bacterium]|nr:ATP-binding protein [Bryobacteraceae bacterium]